MKYTKEVKTAVLALAAILVFIFGYSYLKGNSWFDSSRTFYAVYTDVEGLSPSSPVTINGFKVGNVENINFLDASGKLIVRFTVDSDFLFSEESIAQVYGGGLIGGKSLAVIPNYQSDNVAESGDTLPSEIEEGLLELVNERLTPLQEKVETAIESTDSLINSFNEVMNPTTRQNLKESIANLNLAVASFKNTAQSVEGILDESAPKINNSLTNISEMSENLNTFSDSLVAIDIEEITSNLKTAIANLETITEKINSGDGTAAKFINDPSVYNNLEEATQELEQLIEDIKLNPRRYVHFSVFGGDSKPYEEPEELEVEKLKVEELEVDELEE